MIFLCRIEELGATAAKGVVLGEGADALDVVVVEKNGDARKPVGLLFAGSSRITILNPIDAVLSGFDRVTVTIDGQ